MGMALKDRLRGVPALDATAGLIALLAVGGVLWSPKLSNTFAKANGSVKPVQVMVDVRRVSAADPEALVQEALAAGRTSIIIRNQPAGSVKLIRVEDINRVLVAVKPDGSVVTAPDPNRASINDLNARFVLEGDATVSKSGVVLAGTKLKVGTPLAGSRCNESSSPFPHAGGDHNSVDAWSGRACAADPSRTTL